MASTSRTAARRANASQSQPEAPFTRIDDQVRAILNFILCYSASRIPIKVTDLTPLASNKIEMLKRLPLVTKLLDERYGLKLTLLDGTPKRYICLAESAPVSIHELTASQRPQHTMLYILLTYIFVRNNRIEEEKLYAMLNSMDVDVHEEHGYFGDDMCTLIQETFCKQQYLKRDRSQLSPYDDPKFYYTWGPRAKSEVGYQQIVEFAAKLFNQDVSFFQQQLLVAQGLDNPEVLQRMAASANEGDTSYFDINDESQDMETEN